MPCYDHRTSPSYINKHEVQPLKRTNEQLAARVNKYARWMCWLLQDREAKWIDKKPLPRGLQKWAKEHREFDNRRNL